ncbi:major facilitator superfamily domain-containing protein [Hygrophoropsis aurantiaca]|uniref:Major facilitator superfamily domain-containing protein n=1 Tax=Hygrophoropsis aurantiaca TaxID=72124 RepID=A0ACB8ARP3_9AGAM|nr:major facilitator superfamily domain-containing protein [Hygrophoropsis aurantiaca]
MFKLFPKPSQSLYQHDRDVNNPDFKLPKMASLIIICCMNVLLQLSFFIIVSSSNKYAEYLGGDATFSGIVIGIPTVFSMLTLIPLTRFTQLLGKYTRPLHLSCGAGIIGNVLYAIAYRTNCLYLILVGRCVLGISFSMWMYCKRYCSDPRIVGIRRRTTLASSQVIGQGFGMSAGPFLGGLLYKVGFANRTFNGYTSPGWLMAGLFLIFWIFVTVFFEDVPDQPQSIELQPISDPAPSFVGDDTEGNPLAAPPLVPSATSTRPASPVQETFREQLSQISRSQWGVIACMCWFSMGCFFILGSWEAGLPVYGASVPQLNWSPFAAGNFIALGGITCFPFLLANLAFARRIQDRNLLAFGSFLGLTGLVIFLSLFVTSNINYGSLFACWWTVALGFNLATTVTLSLLSKQLPPGWNTRTSLAIQYSNYTGRVTGAIWGGSGVSVGMKNFVGVEIAIVGIGAVLFTSFWRDLKAKTG